MVSRRVAFSVEFNRLVNTWPGLLLLAGLILADMLSAPLSARWAFGLWAVVLLGWMVAIVYVSLASRFNPVLLIAWLGVSLLNWPHGLAYVVWGLFCLALFAVGKPEPLRRVAWWVGLVYFPFTWFSGGNTNIQAMAIWLVFLLAQDRPIWWCALAFGSLGATGSEGGWLALAAGLIVERWGWKWLWPGLVLVPVVAGLKMDSNSVTDRLGMWGRVVGNFTPWGHGLGSFHFDQWGQTHNLVMSAAQVAGWPGLLALVLALAWLVSKRAYITPWAGLVAAFAVHSMVDNPHWGVAGAVLSLIFGNIYSRSRQDGTIHWWFDLPGLPGRVRLFVLRLGEGLAPLSHRQGQHPRRYLRR